MTITLERGTLAVMTLTDNTQQDLEKFRNGRFAVALLMQHQRSLTDAGYGADWGMDADAMRRGAVTDAERRARIEPMAPAKIARLQKEAEDAAVARAAYLAREVVGVASGRLTSLRKKDAAPAA